MKNENDPVIIPEVITPQDEKSKSENPITPYILFGLALLYTISPIDLVPDIPVVGWIDDIAILAGTGLNLIEKNFLQTNGILKTSIRWIKWGFLTIGIGLALIIGLLIAILWKVAT